MAVETVHFSDFGKGEYGTFGSWTVGFSVYRGTLIYNGYWTGSNVVRYPDGSLGPRNGVKAFELTSGMPAAPVIALGTNMSGTRVWFQTDTDAVYYFQVGGNIVLLLGAGGGDAFQAAPVGEDVYYITESAGIRKIDFSGAPDVIAGSPNGRHLARYGDRLVAAGDPAHPNRVYYSDVANFTSWPAANFFDVGPGDGICSLIPFRNGLAIVTSQIGTAGLMPFTWWVLTGVPGVNDALRQVLTGQGPDKFRAGAVLQDGRIAFPAPAAQTVAFFDGSRTSFLEHLSFGEHYAQDHTTLALRDDTDVLFTSSDSDPSSTPSALLRRSGTWLAQSFSDAASILPLASFVGGWSRSLVVFADYTTPPAFHMWDPYNDKPPFSADLFATILDPTAVTFTLPEWYARDGHEVQVRKIVVDFTSWNTGDSHPNTFDIDVTPKRRWGGGDGAVVSTTTGSLGYSEATSASAATGTQQARAFSFFADYATGFQVTFKNLRGCAISRITVVHDGRPMQAI